MTEKKAPPKEIKLNILVVGGKSKEISVIPLFTLIFQVVLIENWRYDFRVPIVEEATLDVLIQELLKIKEYGQSHPRIVENVDTKISVKINEVFNETVTRKLRENKDFTKPKDLKVSKFVDVFEEIQGKTVTPFVELDMKFLENGKNLSPNALYSDNQRQKEKIEELIVEKTKIRERCIQLEEANEKLKKKVENQRATLKLQDEKKESISKKLRQVEKKLEKDEEIQKLFKSLKKQYHANIRKMQKDLGTFSKKVEKKQEEFNQREKEHVREAKRYKDELNSIMEAFKKKEELSKKKMKDVEKTFGRKVLHGIFSEEHLVGSVDEEMKKKEKIEKKKMRELLENSKKSLQSALKNLKGSLELIKE